MNGLRILSIDHRVPLIELADRLGAPRERLAAFKSLVVDAALDVAGGRDGFGLFMDGGYGAAAIAKARAAGLWVARPIDRPHARALRFEEDGDVAEALARWPADVVVKCAVYLHPADAPDMLAGADRALAALHQACERAGRDLLLEVLSSPHGPVDETTVATLIARIYRLGVRPRWWLIEDQPRPSGWRRCGDAARAHDPGRAEFLTIARTIKDFPEVSASALSEPLAAGFCAGRCMFAAAIEPWLRGEMADAEAVQAMAANFAAVVAAWDAPRAHPVA